MKSLALEMLPRSFKFCILMINKHLKFQWKRGCRPLTECCSCDLYHSLFLSSWLSSFLSLCWCIFLFWVVVIAYFDSWTFRWFPPPHVSASGLSWMCLHSFLFPHRVPVSVWSLCVLSPWSLFTSVRFVCPDLSVTIRYFLFYFDSPYKNNSAVSSLCFVNLSVSSYIKQSFCVESPVLGF